MADSTRGTINWVWADTGAKTAPIPTKIQTGWEVEVPPHQWQNWWQERADTILQSAEEYGVMAWNSLTSYKLGALTMGSDGRVYRATSINVGFDPVLRTTNSQWELAWDGGGCEGMYRGEGHQWGCTISRNAADAQKIDLSPGVIRENGDANFIRVWGTMTRDISGVWGTADGGRPSTVTLTPDTWYNVFVIRNPVSGAIDLGFDAIGNMDAQALLADANGSGFFQYKHLMYVRTDSSSDIVMFHQDAVNPNRVEYDLPFLDLDISNTPTAATTFGVTCPPDVVALLQVSLWVGFGGSFKAIYGRISPKSFTMPATIDKTNANVTTAEDPNWAYAHSFYQRAKVDSLSELHHNWNDANPALEIRCIGFEFDRSAPT